MTKWKIRVWTLSYQWDIWHSASFSCVFSFVKLNRAQTQQSKAGQRAALVGKRSSLRERVVHCFPDSVRPWGNTVSCWFGSWLSLSCLSLSAWTAFYSFSPRRILPVLFSGLCDPAYLVHSEPLFPFSYPMALLERQWFVYKLSHINLVFHCPSPTPFGLCMWVPVSLTLPGLSPELLKLEKVSFQIGFGQLHVGVPQTPHCNRFSVWIRHLSPQTHFSFSQFMM